MKEGQITSLYDLELWAQEEVTRKILKQTSKYIECFRSNLYRRSFLENPKGFRDVSFKNVGIWQETDGQDD